MFNNDSLFDLHRMMRRFDDMFPPLLSEPVRLIENGDATNALSLSHQQAPLHVKLDVSETDKSWTLHADLPGLNKDQVKIDIDPETKMLTISGERQNESVRQQQSGEDGNIKWRRVERSYGRFSRSMRLPESADIDRIKAASMENGVLELQVPKSKVVEKKGGISVPIH